MELQRRALFNFLKMEHRRSPSTALPEWQVADLRAYDAERLFEQALSLGFEWDKAAFAAVSQGFETPEETADFLTRQYILSPEESDRLYLLVFELWRRFSPEKVCLSLFCDELDYQIWQYDEGHCGEAIQDTVENLRKIIEDSVDQGVAPEEIMLSIESHCSNDIDSFLYDYANDQIEQGLWDYAEELIEGFEPFVRCKKWFAFLRAKLEGQSTGYLSEDKVAALIGHLEKVPDIGFSFELLEFLADIGHPSQFIKLARHTLPLLQLEEDIQDFLALCLTYFSRLEQNAPLALVDRLLSERAGKPLTHPIDPLDPAWPSLTALLG